MVSNEQGGWETVKTSHFTLLLSPPAQRVTDHSTETQEMVWQNDTRLYILITRGKQSINIYSEHNIMWR